MYDGQWIQVTGLANAAYLRDVVLPACERRAAQQQLLAERSGRQSKPWSVTALLGSAIGWLAMGRYRSAANG
jgi:hypothetical protein